MSPFKPLLASEVDFTCLRFPVYGSPKLDGVRAIVRGGKVFSRSNKLIPNLEVQRKFGRLEGYDGELIVGEPWAKDVYRKTVSTVMSVGKSAQDVTLFVFDSVLNPSTPYHLRYAELAGHAGVEVVPQTLLTSQETVLEYESRRILDGYEGVMLRNPNAAYKFGRSTSKEQILLKLKRFTDAEAKVIGFTERLHNANEAFTNELGRTARTSHQENKIGRGDLGALVALFEGIEFNIGSGFTDSERLHIWLNRDAYLGHLVKFKYLPTGGKVAPRHPIFLGWRSTIDL